MLFSRYGPSKIEFMRAYIYALYEPDGTTCRYVGRTSRPMGKSHTRWSEHKSGHDSSTGPWIKQLRRNGEQPIIKVLQTTTTDDWVGLEHKWIKKMRDRGHPLINKPNLGMTGHAHSAETRAKMSAAKLGNSHVKGKTWTLSAETRQRQSAAWDLRRSAINHRNGT